MPKNEPHPFYEGALVEMDGFEPHQAVVVLAATNRPDVLDLALLRPGRFDRQSTVDLPERRGRQAILRIHTRTVPLSPDVNLADLARVTPGFSGADLENLVNEAVLAAARRDSPQVSRQDFENALDKLLLGGKREALVDERERRAEDAHSREPATILLRDGSKQVLLREARREDETVAYRSPQR